MIPTLGNDKDRLLRCLESVKLNLPPDSRTVVVWNSLEPCSLDILGVDIYLPGVNLGYGPALNVVAERYTGDYLWLVQDDMVIPDGMLADFVDVLDEFPLLAVISPGKRSKDQVDPVNPRGGGIQPNGRLGKPPQPKRAASKVGVEYLEMDWVPLSGALVKKSSFDEIGGFDLRLFPVGHTDVDLCWRLGRAGYSVGASTSRAVIHQKAASTPWHLAKYLFDANGAYFRSKVSGEVSELPDVDVPPEVLVAVAQVATHKLLDFSIWLTRFQEANQAALQSPSKKASRPKRFFARRRK